jgi:hypothetical protein
MSDNLVNYTGVPWKDYPDTSTKLNAKNLNIMDKGIQDTAAAVNQLNSNLESVKPKILWSGTASQIGYLINLKDDISNYQILMCQSSTGFVLLRSNSKNNTVYYIGSGSGAVNLDVDNNQISTTREMVILEKVSNTQLKVRASGFFVDMLISDAIDTTKTDHFDSKLSMNTNPQFNTYRPVYSVIAIKLF